MILGTAASAYSSGFYALLYPLGLSLGFVLLGSGIAGRLQECEVITTAELFEKRYPSRNLRKLASTLSLLTLFGILTAQVVCIKTILASLGYSNWVAVTFWLLVAGYTMIGGIRAITLNDIVQLILIVIVFTALCIYLSFNSTVNWALMSQKTYRGLFPDSTFSSQQTLSLIFVPALFSLIEQDLAQRFFAAKSKTVASRSALIAAVFLLIFSFIPIYLGILARFLKIPVSEQANPIFSLLEPRLPSLAYSFVLCGIFAAIISTADALINGICANLTEDFSLKERIRSEKQAPWNFQAYITWGQSSCSTRILPDFF